MAETKDNKTPPVDTVADAFVALTGQSLNPNNPDALSQFARAYRQNNNVELKEKVRKALGF